MADIETQYNLALDYLYSFVDYSLKHSSELAKAEFNLDRMFALMEKLGNPHTKYPIIHVAGTKGKGSTSALCAAALQAAGYKVGLYTSPHLEDYCERIQINGRPVSHAQLVQLVEQVKDAVAQIPKLTTFEITTAIGFLFFAGQIVDAAVIEVGLGGGWMQPMLSRRTSRSSPPSHTTTPRSLATRLQRSQAKKRASSSRGFPLYPPRKKMKPTK